MTFIYTLVTWTFSVFQMCQLEPLDHTHITELFLNIFPDTIQNQLTYCK